MVKQDEAGVLELGKARPTPIEKTPASHLWKGLVPISEDGHAGQIQCKKHMDRVWHMAILFIHCI